MNKRSIPTIRIGDTLEIPRVVSGLWQVSGGHGAIDPSAAVAAMGRLHEAGLTAFDMADHYGPAEELTRDFLRTLPDPRHAQVSTKWCPEPAEMTGPAVEEGVRRSLDRLGQESVDLMQFHWWDYLSFAYLDAARHLQKLKERGLIRNLGLTNFDTAHLRILLSLGVEIATNQVHYSLLDRRPAGAMAQLCGERGVQLLCYGTLAGGFLSERWLNRDEPTEHEIAGNWSLMKYHRFIQVFGGWDLFQELLHEVHSVAAKHGVSIPNVAVRWVLEQPAVAAVLVGTRLGLSDHTQENLRVFDFRLDDEDRARIDAVLARSSPIPGDCGDEYRKPPFLTASGDLSHHRTRAWRRPLLPPGPKAVTPRTSYGTGTSWEQQASYSRAVRLGDRVAVSGTTATYRGEVIGKNDAAAQAHFCVDIIESALQALGAELTDVVRTRLYVPQMERDWRAVAGVHGARFAGIRPANTLVSAALVGEDYLVEMEADALLSTGGEP